MTDIEFVNYLREVGKDHKEGLRECTAEDYENAADLIQEMFEALEHAEDFFNSLPEGWLGKVSADIGALNNYFLTSRKVFEKVRNQNET